MSGWAAAKAAARKVVHATFQRAATYAAPGSIDDPVDCTVRWHAKGARMGDLDSAGYAELVATEDRIVFDKTIIAFKPERGGIVTLLDDPGLSFRLEVQAEEDGPVTDIWTVTRACSA